MASSPSRRRLHRLPALLLGLILALIPIVVFALPRESEDLTPARPASSPLEKAGDPARAYRASYSALTALGLEQEQIRILWARMGERLLPALEGGELAPEELDYLVLPHCHENRMDAYLAYAQANPDLGPEAVVTAVNIGLDRDFYTDPTQADYPASPTVLVNKYHSLSDKFVPELVELGRGYGSGSLTPTAAVAFRQMADSARADGISLRSVSAYRSYDQQVRLYQRYVSQYGSRVTDNFSARAGHSEHQTGLSLDINVARSSAHFERTREFAWLQENCARFGFILRYPQDKKAITGYRFEPWHYRYVGLEVAQFCMEEGLTYEEYVAQRPVPLKNQATVLYCVGEPLDLDALMLDGVPYLSAQRLARQLGWSARREGDLLVLTRGADELVFQPGRNHLHNGALCRLSAPAVELEDGLYLPLSDLCGDLGLTIRDTGWGLELTLPSAGRRFSSTPDTPSISF